MYSCGHRNGMVVELWPGDIIELSRCVTESFDPEWIHFEIFAKVGDNRNYEDELLQLPSHEAMNWIAGLTILQEGLSGRVGVDQDALGSVLACVMAKETASQANLRWRFNQVAGTFTALGRLRQTAEELQQPTFEAIRNKIVEAVSDAMKLCRASIQTGTPILLHW